MRSKMDQTKRRDSGKLEFIKGRGQFAGRIEWIREKEETEGRRGKFLEEEESLVRSRIDHRKRRQLEEFWKLL